MKYESSRRAGHVLKIGVTRKAYQILIQKLFQKVFTLSVPKVISIAYLKCVSVALVIQRAKCMHRIDVCGLSGFAIFFPNYLIYGTIFEKKKSSDHKIRFDVLLTVHLSIFISVINQ